MRAIEKNIVYKILCDKAPYGFIPNVTFYTQINIKRKMWAMILRGEREPTISQLKAICLFFEVDIKDYL